MEDNITQTLDGLRGRGRTYVGLLAPVVALLLLGLALPFVAGEPMTTGVQTGRRAIGNGSGGAAGDLGTGETGPEGPSGVPGPAATTPTSLSRGAAAVDTTGALGGREVGVSADAIKVAVFVPKRGGFAGAGFAVDLGDSRAAFSAFFKELNEAGGIRGRRIEASYIDFDPLQDASMRNACLTATEDQKVFATFNINGFYGPGILCVSEEHHTPLMEAYYSEPDEWYQRSSGMYVTAYPSKSRTLRNMVYELHRRGLLKGHTLGIVDSDYPFDKVATDTALLPALKELGYRVAHRSTLSSDAATSQAQIPLEVQRMQAAGVDTIFFAGYFVYVTTWVQQAANRQYFPQYMQSDYANGTADGGTRNMPESYAGTIGVTSTRVGEHRLGRAKTSSAARCVERWNRLTGVALEPNGADETIMLGACGSVDVFAAAARAAGPNLTRAGLRAGYASLGTIEFPLLAPFAWGQGKFAGGDQVRLVEWNFERNGAECRCWIPVDEFHAAAG